MNNIIYIYDRKTIVFDASSAFGIKDDYNIKKQLNFFFEREFKSLNIRIGRFFEVDLLNKTIQNIKSYRNFRDYYNITQNDIYYKDIEMILKIHESNNDIYERILFQIPNDYSVLEEYMYSYYMGIIKKRKVLKNINLIYE